MGQGYSFECKKCKNTYFAKTGMGMLYPLEYLQLIKEIEDGRYGEEWKQLLMSNPDATVYAGDFVYSCTSCGHWEQDQDITLYVPDDPEALRQKRLGETERCVMPQELKDEYHVLKRHYHKCEKCGKRMHKASRKEMRHLPCPKCGSENEGEALMWD